ncbi:hypothetical protein Leryth_005510 [Lithospermum erythrorhizon]|nr:hypothetical protein Leryth_005510 [Lithospermum erythrorhizon]
MKRLLLWLILLKMALAFLRNKILELPSFLNKYVRNYISLSANMISSGPQLLCTDILNFFEGVTLVILIIHTSFPLAYEGGEVSSEKILNKLKTADGDYLYLKVSSNKPLCSVSIDDEFDDIDR